MPASRKNISEIHHLRSHITVAGFGIVTYRKGGRLGPRRQKDYQLVVIHRGGLALTIDGVEHRLGPGQGILLGPGSEEDFRFSADEETVHSWCQIPPEKIPPGLAFPVSALNRVLDCDPWLLATMKSGWRTPADALTAAGRHMIVSAVLTAIWAFCRADATESRTPRPQPEPLVKALKYLGENLTEPLTLADLARAAAVSGGHLIKLAGEHWGMTPMERLWQERVDTAARLLRETGLGISEIAYRTGFSNPFHFSRRFKQRHSLHPRAWRLAEWEGGMKV